MFPSCRAAGRPGGRVRGGRLLSYYCSLSICTQSVLRSVHLPACLSACLSGRGRQLTVAGCGAGVGIAAMAAEVNEGGVERRRRGSRCGDGDGGGEDGGGGDDSGGEGGDGDGGAVCLSVCFACAFLFNYITLPFPPR